MDPVDWCGRAILPILMVNKMLLMLIELRTLKRNAFWHGPVSMLLGFMSADEH
jgi:hypothetical protein